MTASPAAEVVFGDLQAEEERLEEILEALDDTALTSPSGAAGWSVVDVVLHLAQSEELVVVAAAQDPTRRGEGWAPGAVDDTAERMVRSQRAEPAVVVDRWRRARRRGALEALRTADPGQPLPWVATPLRPAALATTRLAEHWAHGLDIVGPLGVPFPDTGRLRHIAWLGHRTLPYAFTVSGLEPPPVRAELTGPDGDVWRFGPDDAESAIEGDAGPFCRVGAQRLAPDESGLRTSGPHAATALRLLRNYAV